MRSPLGPVLADVFMDKLRITIVPLLREYLGFQIRYVDNNICFVKIGAINYVITILNNFDPDITFTQEVKKDCKLSFL